MFRVAYSFSGRSNMIVRQWHVKRLFTTEPIKNAAPDKNSRLNRVMKTGGAGASAKAQGKKSPIITARGVVVIGGCFAVGYAVVDMKQNKEGFLGQLYWGSVLQKFISSTYDQVFSQVNDAFLPSADALLPTWPTDPYYAAVPPGTPVPPLLVLDLEKTAIGSEYDARYGWRHVKRPGLDKFLQQLSPYYEIVIFSENDIGVQQELLLAIDKENRCFKLGSSAAELRDNVYLKRLDYMNRDIRKIVLIDDDERASSLFPRNRLLVTPYTDIRDKTDTELLDLVPLLQALVHEQVDDYRDTLDALGTHVASEAATEYQMKVAARRNELDARKNKGLGGIGRSLMFSRRAPLEAPAASSLVSRIVGSTDSDDEKLNGTATTSSNIEFKGQIKAEVKGSGTKSKGKLMQYLEEKDKERQEIQNLKMEKMNELYQKQMMERKD
jgi:hypothetical protein